MDLVIRLFVSKIEFGLRWTGFWCDFFMLEKLRLPPEATVGWIIASFGRLVLNYWSGFSDIRDRPVQAAPVIMACLATPWIFIKLRGSRDALAETLVFEIARFLGADRRASRNQDQLIVRRQLHDLTRRQQGTRGFLP